ncbi:ATP-binding cassette domain-containing protein [Candidatus Dependentiae bacterium]|nr:ATP-binding cassette domain-containing protein [Candidatus Dependentiae bacterium]
MAIEQLALENISKTFTQSTSQTTILRNVSYAFQTNLSYAIMGPSGVGKSTLLHIISGIEKPDNGHVKINNQIINYHNFEQRIAALHNNIGILFQQPSLINELNVLENVMLTALTHNKFEYEYQQRALELLKSINLEDKAYSSIYTLSGGQQQRIALLRAIFHRPSFLIADEPTGNLDKNSAHQIMDLLNLYQKQYAMGLIISTHDIEIAKRCNIILNIENQNLSATKNTDSGN